MLQRPPAVARRRAPVDPCRGRWPWESATCGFATTGSTGRRQARETFATSVLRPLRTRGAQLSEALPTDRRSSPTTRGGSPPDRRRKRTQERHEPALRKQGGGKAYGMVPNLATKDTTSNA